MSEPAVRSMPGDAADPPGSPADAAAPADPPTTASPAGRRSTALDHTTLAPVALAAACIMVPLGYGLHRLWPPALALLLAGWLGPAALLRLDGPRRLIATRVHRLRQPDPQEIRLLERPWPDVLARAGVAKDRYLLLIADSDALLTDRTAGSIVAVTSHAVRTLPPAELRAVLTRELGVLMCRPPWPRPARQVLAAPGRASWSVCRALWRLVERSHRGARAWGTPAGHLGTALLATIVAMFTTVVAVPAALTYAGLRLCGDTSARRAFDADQATAERGLGAELLKVIEASTAPDDDAPPRGGRRRTLPQRRAERLRALLHERAQAAGTG